jgi:F1F0 ATPase subunit 2
VNGVLGPALLGLLFGIAVGAAFFGGLALTIARVAGSRRPGLLVAGSLLLRLAVAGVALVAIARWLPPAGLLGAALGVLVARAVLVRAAMRGPTGSTGAPGSTGPSVPAATGPVDRR